MTFVNGANVLFPIIIFPYLIRVLGIEKFGLLAFAMAIAAYFAPAFDYGFNLSGTKRIARSKIRLAAQCKTYSAIQIIKTGMMLVSLGGLLLAMKIFGTIAGDNMVLLLLFFSVYFQSLMPLWFFQGRENMQYMTFSTLTSKASSTLLILIFVRHASDYVLVPRFMLVGNFLGWVYTEYILRTHFGMKFEMPRTRYLAATLKDGWYLFMSQLKVTLFSNSNSVILGILTNNAAVGYYVSAEKIMRVLAMATVPLTGALFPYVAREIGVDRLGVIRKLVRVLQYGVTALLIVIVPIAVTAPYLCHLVFADETGMSASLLRIIIICPIFILINNICGTQIMIGMGRERAFFWILLWGGIGNIVLCSLLTWIYGAFGTATSLLIVEAYLAIAMAAYAFQFISRKDPVPALCDGGDNFRIADAKP